MTSSSPHAVNLAEKLGQFDDHWTPRRVAELNGHDVRVVKVRGELFWHQHDDTTVEQTQHRRRGYSAAAHRDLSPR
ncbi:MAG: hypothetical protein WCA82_14560 [Jiangellales bacterium]